MKKNIFAVIAGLAFAVGAPFAVAASQGTLTDPVAHVQQLPKFDHLCDDCRLAAAGEPAPIVLEEITIVGERTVRKSIAASPKCTWHWRDLVQGSGQVYTCE